MTTQKKLLLVDDDVSFCEVMHRALTRRGIEVVFCHTSAQALALVKSVSFSHALVDLKIAEESGLHLISELLQLHPQLPIIMLTGFASISTAVEAIKLGAINYFLKPISVDEVLKGFEMGAATPVAQPMLQKPSLQRLAWEHIQKTLQEHQGNVSAAARALGVHRRTLQRKLQKRPAAEDLS